MRRTSRRTLTILCSAALAICVWAAASTGISAAPPGGNWPQWRGPQRDGVSTETGLLTSWPKDGPPKLFTVTGLGRGFSSVSVAGGRVYTMGDLRNGQHVFALDEDTGKQIWASRIGQVFMHPDEFHGPRGTPTVEGALLYVVNTDGEVVALETATGKERWRKSLSRDFGGRMMSQWNWAESPLVDGDRVVVTPGGARAGIVALNKLTGAEIWRATIPSFGNKGADGAGYSSIVISNGAGVKQYVQLMGRGVVGVRASDGAFLWGNNAVANDIANISTPVVKDNYVFASTSYDTGSALIELAPGGKTGVTATQRYFLDPGKFQSHHGGFVLLGNYLYGGHGQNHGFPVCIELTTGKLMWPDVRGAGTGSASVVAADGRLYFRYQNGIVALVEATPATYRELGSFQIPNPHTLSWPHPVVAGGRLYLRELDALHVYNVKR
jgi:outer membrane protein assembly factor BamB